MRSVISKKTFDSLPLISQGYKSESKCVGQSISGQDIAIFGEIVVPTKIGQFTYLVDYLIIETAIDPVIIGNDFLEFYKGGIVFISEKRCLEIKGEIIPIITESTPPENSSIRRLKLSKHVRVQPGAKVCLPVKMSSVNKHGCASIIQADPDITKQTELFTPNGVIDSSKRHWQLNFIYLGEKARSFKKGTCLAVCQDSDDGINVESWKERQIRIAIESDEFDESNPAETLGSLSNRLNKISVNESVRENSGPNDSENSDVNDNMSNLCDPARAEIIKNMLPEHVQDLFMRSIVQLTEAQCMKLKDLLFEFSDVFSKNDDDLGYNDQFPHKINTGDSAPVQQAPRRMSVKKREILAKEIEKMKNNGLIEESFSPYAANTVIVTKKKNNESDEISYRICTDYRDLNKVTIKDCYKLPNVDECLDSLAGAQYLSNMDLSQGYLQTALDIETAHKSAFYGPDYGLWQYKVLPYGLQNAPAGFQRLMDNSLRGLSLRELIIFIDDLLSHAKDFKTALERLKTVFTRLRAANLKLKPKKCNLLQPSVSFLGYLVSKNGLESCPRKIEMIQKWPRPSNLTETRGFLGFCQYLRRFVSKFSEIARPLHELSALKTGFYWNQDCELSFLSLKEALKSPPVLAFPTADDPYVLDTDASGVAIAGILLQVQNGQERVIAYHSRCLDRDQRKTCTTSRELLAIIDSLKQFKVYLYNPFKVRTDHNSLRWLLNFKNLDGKLGRWLNFIATFPDFVIEFRPGVKHILPDRASRRPCDGCRHCERVEAKYIWMEEKSTQTPSSFHDIKSPNIMAVKTKKKIKSNNKGLEAILNALEPLDWPTNVKDKKDAQNTDPILKWVIEQKLTSPVRPAWESFSGSGVMKRILVTNWDLLVLHDGVLYHEWITATGSKSLQLVIPEGLKISVLKQMHSDITAGHFGVLKTKQRILQRFWWPCLSESIKSFIDKCDPCAFRNRPHSNAKGAARHCNIGLPNERLDFDICGPLPVSLNQNRWCLTLIDKFTKWTAFIPLKETSAETLAHVLINNYFSVFGTYSEIYTDQGKNVDGNTIRELAKILQSIKVRTIGYHPQANGACEHRNLSFAQMIAKFTRENPRNWDDLLPLLTLSLNSAVSASTGFSPAKLMLARELRLPLDLMNGPVPNQKRLSPVEYVNEVQAEMFKVYDFARDNIQGSSENAQRRWNSRCRPGSYKVGDTILLKRYAFGPGPKKFKDKWQGPYLVVSVVNDVMYRVQTKEKGDNFKIVHFDRMKSYHGDNYPNWIPKVQKSISEAMVSESRSDVPPSHSSYDLVIGDVLASDRQEETPAPEDQDLSVNPDIASQDAPVPSEIPVIEDQDPIVNPETASQDAPVPSGGRSKRKVRQPDRLGYS